MMRTLLTTCAARIALGLGLGLVLCLAHRANAAGPEAATTATTPTTSATPMSAAQIVSRNVAARGGLAAWRNISTLTFSGQMDAGGKQNVELPYVMRLKRGHKSRLEIRFQEQTAVQVFDGKQGWKLRPFLNRGEVEAFTADEVRAAAAWDELDGPLIDHTAKGIKVDFVGSEAVDGRATYKLRLVSPGGEQRHLWVDAGTFLEVKIEGPPRRFDGRLRKVVVLYRDFLAEGAVTIPRTFETVLEGVKPGRKLQITKVLVNEPMAEHLFARPELAMVQAPLALAGGGK